MDELRAKTLQRPPTAQPSQPTRPAVDVGLQPFQPFLDRLVGAGPCEYQRGCRTDLARRPAATGRAIEMAVISRQSSLQAGRPGDTNTPTKT
jgi:hypothetical protein